MKVCLVVPDGVGIRNYLFTDLLPKLISSNCEIVIWHSLTSNAINEVKLKHPSIIFEEYPLPKFSENKMQRFLRESAVYARLLYNTKIANNPTIMDNKRQRIPKKFLARTMYRMSRLIGCLASKDYNYILWLEKKYLQNLQKSNVLDNYKDFLTSNNIDKLLCTHQRSISAIPAVEAGNSLGLDTFSVIYSWDNLPKGRLNARSKYYCVWSKYMKHEMVKYYPEIDNSNIEVTGTPQFEFYKDKSLLKNKEEFFVGHGLDQNKKVICFSGDDIQTSPFDAKYLEDLAKNIKDEGNMQILFRKCPVDFSTRYDEIIEKYSDIIKVANPLWNFDEDNNGNWELVYPSYEDVKLLVNTAYHCDAVYNVGSTMAHDFALFNKPALYINYDNEDGLNYNSVHKQSWSTERIYQFEHFKSMKNLEAVLYINHETEILDKVKLAVFDPLEIAVQRIEWLNIVTDGIFNASENIKNYILNTNNSLVKGK